MKAIVLNEHGGPDVLHFGDVPDPAPGRGDVLVRLHVAALNRLDIWVRAGWPGIRLQYPHIPGADGAGEIAALGEGVSGWSVGDRVVLNSNIGCGECSFCLDGAENRCERWNLLGETRAGTYARLVAVPARNLYKVPEDFDLRAAAAAALVFHTAWHSLVTRGNLRPGEHVLVVGSSGGVNTACIQIARMLQAKVYVVGSSPEKLELARSLGAEVLINRHKTPDWSREVFLRSGKRGMDVVVDNVGSTFPLSIRAARKGGRILTVGNTGGPLVQIDNRYLFARHLALIGSTMGTQSDFRTVMDLVFNGVLHPVLDRAFPLSDAADAQMILEEGSQLGKITLDID
jgi:NADPH:quinone reductase-like Zn-dependent oxidoreductase